MYVTHLAQCLECQCPTGGHLPSPSVVQGASHDHPRTSPTEPWETHSSLKLNLPVPIPTYFVKRVGSCVEGISESKQAQHLSHGKNRVMMELQEWRFAGRTGISSLTGEPQWKPPSVLPDKWALTLVNQKEKGNLSGCWKAERFSACVSCYFDLWLKTMKISPAADD